MTRAWARYCCFPSVTLAARSNEQRHGFQATTTLEFQIRCGQSLGCGVGQAKLLVLVAMKSGGESAPVDVNGAHDTITV